MLSFIHWSCDPELVRIGSFGIRYYSLCWVIGIASGYFVVKKMFKKEKLDVSTVDALLVYVCLGALIGARLGHCLFYDFKYFSHNPLEIILPVTRTPTGFKFTGYAGLASHGGAVGVVLALVLFSRKHHVKLLSLLDKLAFVAPLAGAFIRIGNFFNSEILGSPSSVPWAVVFDRVDNIPRHPAQLYEAMAYFIIFTILIFTYRKIRTRKLNDGVLFGLSITFIFFARFFIEYCKEVQEPFEIGLRASLGMDMGQLLSLPFVVIGLYFFIRGVWRKPCR